MAIYQRFCRLVHDGRLYWLRQPHEEALIKVTFIPRKFKVQTLYRREIKIFFDLFIVFRVAFDRLRKAGEMSNGFST